MIKVAFDIGGVLSKYPQLCHFMNLLTCAHLTVEVHIISDMHPKADVVKQCRDNGILVDEKNIHSADYATYGEYCKAKLCKELSIDILVDDFVGYLADGKHIRLLVMPDSTKPYWHNDWVADGDFGRRVYKGDK